MAVCTRCSECIRVCEQSILVPGSSGFPEVDFSRGECTFCGRCADVCPTGALGRSRSAAPWGLKATIGDACLARAGVVCRTCGDACDSRAMRFIHQAGAVARPAIDLDACTGCGACVAPCPVGAVSVTEQRIAEEGRVA